MTGRESDLYSCLTHLFWISTGPEQDKIDGKSRGNKEHNIEWIEYHLRRSTQGLEQKECDLIWKEFRIWKLAQVAER